jgi:peptidoglycan-N-acetylglucosamine deacetylase
MMRIKVCGLVLALLLTPALAREEKKIALTFDNLPAMKPLGYWTPREISNTILRTLEAHEIKAAGFVIGEKIDDDPSSFIVLEDWVSRGHILGNQTYSNVDLNELTPEDFLHHAGDGQKHLWSLSKRIKFNYRYFRFPQLHEGNTSGKKKDVRRALSSNGYEIVPVTVKTSDYRFNRPYLAGQSIPEKVADLRAAYLGHIGQMLDYAEKQSQAVFERQIPHILGLRGGIATASFLDDLVSMLKERGYVFVAMPEALADPAYQTPETYVGPLGLSFLDRVAATMNLPYDPDHGEVTDSATEVLLDER